MTTIKTPFCGWDYFESHKCENCPIARKCELNEEMQMKQQEKKKDIERKQNKKLKKYE